MHYKAITYPLPRFLINPELDFPIGSLAQFFAYFKPETEPQIFFGQLTVAMKLSMVDYLFLSFLLWSLSLIPPACSIPPIILTTSSSFTTILIQLFPQ